jgi:Kef-type K+ transport system membrane component KefB
MTDPTFLIALGVLFLAGLALDKVGRIVHVPRVTLLIVLGAVLGPSFLDVLPRAFSSDDDIYASAALTMVAFLLGGSLKRETLAAHGRVILTVSLTVVFVSVALVGLGLAVTGVPLSIGLILGGVAAATDPAATRDVIRQSGQSDDFTTNILGIVAIDDAWGVLVFSVVLALAGMLIGDSARAIELGLWEVAGGAALGLVLGIPGALLTGRLKGGEPTLLEAVGLVLLIAGLALWLHVSFHIAGMVAGATIVNLARHHNRPFHEIERIEWPFMLLFFVIAGASLDIDMMDEVGAIGLVYVGLRIMSRVLGGMAGGRLAGLDTRTSALVGLALMPQAGVAIGMALLAAERFPDFGEQLLAITIASTIVFEVIGPVFTQMALRRVAAAAPCET